MTVDAAEYNRMIRADRVEFLRRRKQCRLPKTLIPTFSVYPRSWPR